MHETTDRDTGSVVSRRALLRSIGAVTAGALVAGAGTDGLASYNAVDSARLRARATNSGDPASTRVFWHGRMDERLMALTFDDGPSATYTPALLEVLADEQVPATFCVIGRNLQADRAIARQQVAAGHELVNHTWSHADLSMSSRSRVLAELRRTEDLIASVTGARPTLLRPPFGRLSGTVLSVAAELEYDVLLWDEQVIERRTTVAANVQHVVRGFRPGMVLLAHDAGPARRRIGMASVRPIVQAAKAQGYRFVTATELLTGSLT